MCIKPVRMGTAGPWPCGQCLCCRVNRRRDWTARLLLHHCGHRGSSAFATFTYMDKLLPRNLDGVPVLRFPDIRNGIQRLRRNVGGLKYVLVGEYGDLTMRPHYHALIWFDTEVYVERAIPCSWVYGFTHVGEISQQSIDYTLSYVLKRMQSVDDKRLGGRPPEFSRFSHGLGAAALFDLRRCAIRGEDGVMSLPREFRLGGLKWPVPKYLRVKLKEEGYEFIISPSESQEKAFVSALRQNSSSDAFAALTSFRAVARSVVDGRRERARVRANRRLLGGRKNETL